MKISEEDKINIELEMLTAFIQEMNSKQLEKMNTYAVKLLQDKRYKKKK